MTEIYLLYQPPLKMFFQGKQMYYLSCFLCNTIVNTHVNILLCFIVCNKNTILVWYMAKPNYLLVIVVSSTTLWVLNLSEVFDAVADFLSQDEGVQLLGN